MKKKKSIFKVEEVKRKVKGREAKKGEKNKKKFEAIKVQEENSKIVALTQQLIEGP